MILIAVSVPDLFFFTELLWYLDEVTLLVAEYSFGSDVQAVVTEEGFKSS